MIDFSRYFKRTLFFQTVVPIVLIGALLTYFGSSQLNNMLVARFQEDLQQRLQSSQIYIDEMFKNHFTLLFYMYGTDVDDFAKQNLASQKELLEKLLHLALPNNDAILIEQQDGTVIFKSKNIDALQINQLEKDAFSFQDTVYIQTHFVFKPWQWKISYMLDINNINEITNKNYNFMIAILSLIVVLLLITLSLLFNFTVRKPLASIATQLNNIIQGNYTTLQTHSLFGKEFQDLADHLNTVTDVIKTREEQAHAMLLSSQQNEEYVQNILDSQRDIIIINDTKNIIDVNKSFFNFFDSYKNLEAFKKEHDCVCDFFEKEEGFLYVSEQHYWIDLLFERPNDDHKVKIIKNGVSYIFLIKAAKSQDFNKIILTLTNITELENNKQKLIEAKELAEIATKTKSEFLANMSHEIRTPINGILGFIQIMLRKEMDYESQKRFFLIMMENGKNLLNIINDILDLSKIESGKMEIVPRAYNLKENIILSTEVFVELAQEKKISYTRKIDPTIPDCLLFDDARLNQIIFNLLSNALKFTPEDGQVKLDIRYNKEEEKIFFSVSDTGIGIASENLQKIFNAFEQETRSTSKKYGGTGLGLAISSKFVSLMGGDQLQVTSELGKGSQFFFELPAQICQHKK